MATNYSPELFAAGAADKPAAVQTAQRTHRWKSKSDAAIYYSVFSVLFAFSLIAFAALRLLGQRFSGGVFKSAKRAANGPAGYAVKF